MRLVSRHGLTGLGKTIMGSTHADELMKKYPCTFVLVVCQKSKIRDWVSHYRVNHPDYVVYDAHKWKKDMFKEFMILSKMVIVINYDTLWRRPDILNWKNYHLILDESSLVQNDTAKRTKFILKMNPLTVTLLSGTPCSGTYENLWSQIQLLGWKLTKKMYWENYVDYHTETFYGTPYPVKIVDGYKNVDRLKNKLREHGAVFMKAEEAVDLPEQVENTVLCSRSTEYRDFMKDDYVKVENEEIVGEFPLTKLLGLRKLCGMYNEEKLDALRELLEVTEGRVIIFYNFNEELRKIENIVCSLERPYGIVNGQYKNPDPYIRNENGILLGQYQATSMGLNLQQGNRIIYFTPTLSADLFMQSKARIHRIGQKRTCFYTYLVCEDSVEESIYRTLERKEDFTLELFDKYLTETRK